MDEYINKKSLLEKVELSLEYNRHVDGKVRRNHIQEHLRFIDIIKRLPPEDVKPVIYCWQCKYYNHPQLSWCSLHMDRENPTDFCSWGRK